MELMLNQAKNEKITVKNKCNFVHEASLFLLMELVSNSTGWAEKF